MGRSITIFYFWEHLLRLVCGALTMSQILKALSHLFQGEFAFSLSLQLGHLSQHFTTTESAQH